MKRIKCKFIYSKENWTCHVYIELMEKNESYIVWSKIKKEVYVEELDSDF